MSDELTRRGTDLVRLANADIDALISSIYEIRTVKLNPGRALDSKIDHDRPSADDSHVRCV